MDLIERLKKKKIINEDNTFNTNKEERQEGSKQQIEYSERTPITKYTGGIQTNNPNVRHIRTNNITNNNINTFLKNSKRILVEQTKQSIWDRIKSTANDLGNTAKNIGLGAKSGLSQTGNYIENANENIYSNYKSNRKKQFYTSDKVDAITKANAKVQESSILINKAKNNMTEESKQALENIQNNKIETNLVKKTIQDSIKNNNEKIQENIKNTNNKAIRKVNELAPSIGQMGVGMLASTVNPALGIGYFTTSAGGSYIDDAKQRGMSDKDAFTYGTIMGVMEGATEEIGIENLKKAGKGIKTLVKGKKAVSKTAVTEISNKTLKETLKNYGIGIADNAVQEAIIEPIQEITAGAVGGKGKSNWNNMGQRMLESGINGGLVSAIVGGSNLGISSCVGVVEKINNGQTPTQQELTQAVKDASKQLDTSKMIQDSVQQQVNKMSQQQNTPQTQTNLAQEQNNINQQQINQEKNNIAHNENMNNEQIAKNIINSSYLSNNIKQNLLNEINGLDINNEGLEQIKQIVKDNSNLKSDSSYKTDNDRKRTYMKYKNDTSKYDTKALDLALDAVEENRNGKRTVKQWLEVADKLGSQLAEKNNDEIERIAFRSWNDLKPNTKDSITRYDNRTKTNETFKKFTSDDWVNKIYESVNKTRENIWQTLDGKDVSINNRNFNNVQYAKVENNQNSLYNNIKIGETKNIKIDDISQLIGQGGYRTEEQINSLREDIKKNGITAPIEIYIKNDGTIAIENGNHRLQIARELGIKDIPVKMVDSWENIGLNKENISKENIEEAGGIYNDGDRKNDNNINETSRNRVRSMYNYNEQSQDIGTTKEDVNIPTTESNSNEQTGSIRSKENNRKQIENSNESSIILPTKQKANLPLSENKIETQQNTSEILIPMSDTLKQRKHYKTIMNSSNVTPEARKIAKELIGNDTYVPQNNVNQLENADKRIIKNGADNEAIALRTKVSNGDKITPDDIATGERLIQYYSKTGNKEMLQDTIQNVALAGTQAGQTVQAMSLIHRQTPEGQAMYIQKIVDNMNKEIENRTKGKGKQFDLTPDMIEKIVNSKGKEQLHDNIEAVAKELGQQVPKTTIEKIDSWRYFSMLGNPRTHIRNIIGNLSMGKVQGISNKVAGTIEAVAQKTGIIEERTKTIVPASLETRKFAKEDVKNVMDRLDNGGKFDAKNLIQQYQRTFKSNILENTLGKLYNLNSKALELEDVFGLKSAYKKHLADYMTANKLTSEYFKTGSKESNIKLEKARQYAIQKAQEATFHQVSSLSSLLSQFENKNKFTKLAIGAVIPFKKTPINVAKTGIEYSPVVLVKAFTLDIANLNKGKINANQYIDNLAKGLTGTGITMVGYALAQAGILKASGGSDDEKKTKYDEDRGKQAFSLKIGDKTYTLDWLSPTAIPLFIGAELNNNIKSSEEEQTKEDILDKISNSIDAFSSAMNPMIEMSMLSGLASTIKSFSQGDTQVFQNLAINAGKSYVNQFVPTISGQIARTIDDTERSTTSTKKNAFSKAVDSTGKQILSKIPVASKLLPAKTDVWGNEQKRDENVLMRGLQQMAFPWYDKTVKSTKVDNAISDLYEATGEKSVLPNVTLSSKDFTINKQKYRMTSEEFAQYKKSYGKVSYELLNSLVNSNNYKKMTNEQKKKAIKEIYSYANENNKINYAKSKDLKVDESTIYKTVKAVKKSGGEIKDYFNYIGSTEGLNKDKEKLKVLSDANYSDNTKSAIYSNTIGKEDKLYNIIGSNLNINQYLNYKSKVNNSTKKAETMNYININISGYENRLILAGSKYKLSKTEQKALSEYINKNSKNNQEAIEKYKIFSKNFEVENEKVYYK